MKNLYIDIETYSETPIKSGTAKYAEDAEVLLVAYAIDDGPSFVWDKTRDDKPADNLLVALHDPDVKIVAHNAMFERHVLFYEPLFCHATQDIKRWHCTMVQAMLHGFPGSLSGVCQALSIPEDAQKGKEGRKLIGRFCSPAAKNHKADRYDRHSHPDEWRRFVEYARQDIVATREIHNRLPTWNNSLDMPLWHIDQAINDRGFQVDTALANAGAAASIEEKEIIKARFTELVNGEVRSPTQRAVLHAYMTYRWSIDIPDTKRDTFEAYLRDDPDAPAELVELMQLVMSANKTSTAKYATMASAVSRDGRFRCGLAFSGAARTRRYAGRTFQPQNLPSRGLPAQDEIDAYAQALRDGNHRDKNVDHNMYASAALRNLIVAPEGRTLAVADYSAIEGRVLAWLAGETWKLRAYEEGQDIYKHTASAILGKPIDQITKDERNSFGKVPELALGYQSGAVGLSKFADMYGFKFLDFGDTIKRTSYQHYCKAQEYWDLWGHENAKGMDRSEWLMCETVKLAWRGANRNITMLWGDMNQAVRGGGGPVGDLLHACFQKENGIPYLTILLPSARRIAYARPHITDSSISVEEVNSLTRQWGRSNTYAGRLVQNATQSVARDVLVDAIPGIEAAGFEVVLSVHDEIIAECPAGTDGQDMGDIMAKGHSWTEGLPLEADGFTAHRYKK